MEVLMEAQGKVDLQTPAVAAPAVLIVLEALEMEAQEVPEL
jgi:hypothetical protein